MRKLMPPLLDLSLSYCPAVPAFALNAGPWRPPPRTGDDPRLLRGCVFDCEQPYILTAGTGRGPAMGRPTYAPSATPRPIAAADSSRDDRCARAAPATGRRLGKSPALN